MLVQPETCVKFRNVINYDLKILLLLLSRRKRRPAKPESLREDFPYVFCGNKCISGCARHANDKWLESYLHVSSHTTNIRLIIRLSTKENDFQISVGLIFRWFMCFIFGRDIKRKASASSINWRWTKIDPSEVKLLWLWLCQILKAAV